MPTPPTTCAVLLCAVVAGCTDAGSLAGPVELELSARPVPTQVCAQWLDVRAPRQLAVDVRCAPVDDPRGREQHVVQVAPGQSEVLLTGLRADQDYGCHATTGLDAAAITFRTGPRPSGLPTWTAWGTPASPGYTLFNLWEEGTPERHLVVVDAAGRLRWHHLLDAPMVGVGIDFTVHSDGPFVAGGGPNLPPRLIDWDGTVAHVGPDPDVGHTHHHHAEQVADGSVLTLIKATDTHPSVTYAWTGFVVEARQAWTDELTFRWRSQDAVDAGTLPIPPRGADDPCHANAAAFVDDDPDGPSVWVSCRGSDLVHRIDRQTGELTWSLGAGGDFTLLDTAGEVLDPDQGFSAQHDLEVSVPLVRVHDNGSEHTPRRSRAVELEVDLVTREARLARTWEQEGWYEPIFGGLDALPDGNWLLARGRCHEGCGYQGTEGRTADVTEVDPSTGEVVWSLTLDEPQHSLYRAERVDGCALFHDLAACPDR